MGDPQRSDPAGRRASGARRRGGGMSAGDIEGFAIDPGKVRKWKRYPAYKDSRVEWLGGVPAGWEMSSIKRHFGVQLGKMLQNEANGPGDKLMPYLRAANISWEKILVDDVKEMWFSESEKAQYRIEKGDLLVSEGGDVGRAALWIGELDECYIQNAINRIRSSDGALTSHLYYWMYFLKHVDYIDMLCNKATIAHYTAEKVMNTVYLRPPLPEQHAIAAFLDRETPRIDALIAKKQRFIELLEEKRQAIISHAVTKGLDPGVEMKDSGVEWIGEVPAGWEIKKISYLADKITNGYVGPTRDIFVNNGVIYLQSLHIKRNQIIFDYNYYVSEEWSNKHPRSILKKGDVLIVQTGDIGQVAVVPEEYEGANCHALIIISCTPTAMKGEYLSMLLNSTYGFNSLKRIQTGALHPHLNYHNVKEILIPVPPISEQLAIVEWIVQSSSKIDALINIITLQIEKLHEYRTVLISAAVTGKIDVRGEEGAT